MQRDHPFAPVLRPGVGKDHLGAPPGQPRQWPFSPQCRAGNVKIRRGPWKEELFRVLEGFPDLNHDDEVEACCGALEMLNPPMKG